jgi:NAD(P)-dependent dehydrogenase (short-subunit alcohol dehydrogenase family)
LIFTFAPEPTITAGFAERLRALVQSEGGEVMFVALNVSPEEQERRLVEPGRAAFGKLRSVDLLRRLRDELAACATAMPEPALTIDTDSMEPSEAAEVVVRVMSD